MEELRRSEIDRLLGRGHFAHLGVVDGDAPYVSAVSYVVVEDHLVFRSLEGRRMRAIRSNPLVSVFVSDVDAASGDWESVVASGTAEIVEDDERVAAAVSALIRKYASSYDVLLGISDRMPFQEAFVVAVRLDDVTGRRSGSIMGPKTRPGRL